jgi:hypothetical protein
VTLKFIYVPSEVGLLVCFLSNTLFFDHINQNFYYHLLVFFSLKRYNIINQSLMSYQTFYETVPPSIQQNQSQYIQQLVHDMRQIQKENSSSKSPCCIRPKPCETGMKSFQPTMSGWAPTWINWQDVNLTELPRQVNPIDDRLKIKSLDQMMYWRQMINGAQWWSENTAPHRHARQHLAQFVHQSQWHRGSPYEKKIRDINDTWPAINQRFGQPQYTTF